MSPKQITTHLTAFAFLVATLTAQRALVVAPIAGTGVDFTDNQSAVSAAADGDVVLQVPLAASALLPLGRTSSGTLNFSLPVPDLGLLTTNLFLQVIGATPFECQIGDATSLTLLSRTY